MSDDLVKRLRGNHDDISHEDIYESADRIEQDAQHIDEMYALVAAMNADHTASKTRIEKLEAAFLEIIEMDTPLTNTAAKKAIMKIARKALEGKDG